MKRENNKLKGISVWVLVFFLTLVFSTDCTAQKTIELSDEQVENIVRLSYPYVALYNVINKTMMNVGGWNKPLADTTLVDHTLQTIARPNNDTLYFRALIDVRQEPMILEFSAFDSKYVSLMV